MRKPLFHYRFTFCALLLTVNLWGNYPLLAAEPTAVKIVKPEMVTLERKTTRPASVHAYHNVDVYARVSGYTKQVNVDIGDAVKAGQPLAEIDVPEMFAAEQLQLAEIAQLESEIVRYEAMVALAKVQITVAEADVKKSDAQISADQIEYDRIRKLTESKSISERLRDETLSRLETSKASRLAVVAKVDVAKAALKAAEADASAAKTMVDVAQKKHDASKIMIGYATLQAPFDGVVSQRNLDPGELVDSGLQKKSLFTIIHSKKVRIRVAIPERDVTWADVGDKAEFKCDALGEGKIGGQVTRFAGALDPKTRTMLVEMEIDNKEGDLLPGMFGLLTITLDRRPDRIVVPATALHHRESGQDPVVYVVSADDTVKHVPVSVGLDDGKRIEIIKGLSGKERIVTGMLGRLSPGQKVRVISSN